MHQSVAYNCCGARKTERLCQPNRPTGGMICTAKSTGSIYQWPFEDGPLVEIDWGLQDASIKACSDGIIDHG